MQLDSSRTTPPKIAGSNKYRSLTQCSVLYSAKASDAENKVFAAMTGGLLDYEAVRRDREFEDLIQIVFRSSLRMPDDVRPVTANDVGQLAAQVHCVFEQAVGAMQEDDLAHPEITGCVALFAFAARSQ